MATSIPVHDRFTILAYRGFYDVPRLMLAEDERNVRWIFECRFDDTLDEYSVTYTVYPLGAEEPSATSVLQRHYDDPPANAIDALPVSRFIFDPTARASFELA